MFWVALVSTLMYPPVRPCCPHLYVNGKEDKKVNHDRPCRVMTHYNTLPLFAILTKLPGGPLTPGGPAGPGAP